jgi:tetratricopeptide (TPR) repeat protein
VGNLIVDGNAGEVLKSGVRIDLPAGAFEVLYQVVERKGKVVARGEFEPWRSDALLGQRHPVDMQVVEIKRRLDDGSIIKSARGKGYQLSPALSVESIGSPSRSGLERRLLIALEQLNAHTSAGFRASMENCEELLKEGRIAEACSAIALAHINLGHTGFCRENRDIRLQRARKILATALGWFPAFGSAYALVGLTHLIDYDWDGADANFAKALEYSPDNELAHCFLAHMRTAQGSFEAALNHARIASETDFASAMTVVTEPWMMLFAGRATEAVLKCEEVVSRFGNSGPARHILGDAYCAVGEMDKALEQYSRALEIDFLPTVVSSRGFVYGRMGHRKDALKCLGELLAKKESGKIAYVSGWHEALVRAGLRETKPALDALDKAFDEKCDWLIYLGVDPRWRELRGERRFQSLLRRIGIRKT